MEYTVSLYKLTKLYTLRYNGKVLTHLNCT